MINTTKVIPIGAMARILKVKSSWLRAEAEAGRIPHVTAGDQILFNPSTVIDLLADRAAGKGVDGDE